MKNIRISIQESFIALVGVFLLVVGACLMTGCQPGYFDRNNTQEIAKAEARAETAEKALNTVLGQKENADKALVLARVALDAARAAGMDAEKIAKAEKAVAFAESKKAEAFEFAAKLSAEVQGAKDAAAAAKASGTGQSAAEKDAAVVGGIISAVGSLFGPAGAAGAMGLSGILALLIRSKSKKATEDQAKINAAKDVVWAIEAAKNSAHGGDGVVNFNDPVTLKLIDRTMGAEGKKFVDEVQGS